MKVAKQENIADAADVTTYDIIIKLDNNNDNSMTTGNLVGGSPENVEVDVKYATTMNESDDVNNGRKRASGGGRSVEKAKRMKGEAYMGYRRKNKNSSNIIIQDVPRGERRMGRRCSSVACNKFMTRSCDKVSEEMRTNIFEFFWKKMDWNCKKIYVWALVDVRKPKKSTSKNKELSRRGLYYHLKHGIEKYAVCRTMFLSTLGITQHEVQHWLRSYGSQPKKYLENDNVNNITDESKLLLHEDCSVSDQDSSTSGHKTGQSRRARSHKNGILKDFLSQLPTLPSRYCRKSSSKRYLQADFRSKLHLFEMYKDHCDKLNEEPLGRTQFGKAFDNMNFAIFNPRKDISNIRS